MNRFSQQHNAWEVVIGIETHVQLATQSKLFSGSATHFGALPNTQASIIDLALPGTLPVLNRSVVDCAIKLGLALDAEIADHSVFARKNYFYPDLPKGYQISQFELPVVKGGNLAIRVESSNRSEAYTKTVRITRAHLEEDAGKSVHEQFHGMSGIDLNRAGTPLLEVVTEPDLRSASEAVAYAKALHGLVTWLGICDGNMQEGSFRCDANVSVRPQGQATFGTRCEIKNLNSFRFLEEAIEYEVQRQIMLIEEGGTVVQETRLYDPDRRETRSMRSKEDAHDYRYFPDPDLLPVVIDHNWIATIKASMPSLPAALSQHFCTVLGLSEYQASLLTQSRQLADFFQQTLVYIEPRLAIVAANWIVGELVASLNRDGLDCEHSRITPVQLANLLKRIDDGTLSGKSAKTVFGLIWQTPSSDTDLVDQLIKQHSLAQVSDTTALEKIIDDILVTQEKLVAEFRAGKEKAFNALVGQTMKATQGKANPQQVNELLRKKLQ